MNTYSTPAIFRQLLKKGVVVMPGAFNAATALLIEKIGFEAVYISGAGLSNGMAGIEIEEQEFPKRGGHLPGKKVMPGQEMEEKIRAACDARENPDFLIIVRTDSRAVNGLEDAIKKANRYIKAGADIIFPEALESKTEFEVFSKEIKDVPLMANMTDFGKSPYISAKRFEDMGYSIVIFPMTAFRVAMKEMEEALTKLKKTGTQKGFLDRMQTREELYKD